MVVKSKVVRAETPEQKDSMWTLHTDEDVAEVDAKAKAWTLKHNPRPEWQGWSNGWEKVTSTWVEIQWDAPTRLLWAAGWNPDMQADSAQKTVVNVPEATAQWGQAEQDWRAGLKNPNQHLENYWDDSSLPYQEHPETLWGTSAKYEGEGVKTTSWEEIDRGLTLDQLDPNYKYWQESQIYGSEHDGYIQSRNDRIAIALWNAWIRDPEGIRTWLEKQPWFMNSSEHDRNNTVMSIYKRMWVEPAKEGETEWSPAKWEGMNLEDTEWGKIYGKDTPSETDPDRGIKTEVDPLNITNQMNATREANVKAMLSMKPEDIATSILAGTTPYGEQTLRDIQQYYPSFYALIQDSLKVKKGQQDINAITTNGTLDTEKQTEVSTERIQNDKKDWCESVWGDKSEQLLEQANSDMASNKAASSAEEEMNNCQKDIAELQTRLKNLPQEARKAFKWDVPQYLVSAYVANKSQEIQDKIGELQSRYNAAMNLYQTEWEKYKWGKEYQLKEKQLSADIQSEAFNQYVKKTQLDREVVTDWKWNTYRWDDNWNLQKVYTDATPVQYSESWMKGKWLKNNNPWNITDMTFWAVIGTDGRFAQFATPEDWFDALVEKMKFNQNSPKSRYYWKTILEYYKIYAPESDWNNPVAYANDVVAKYNAATWEHVTVNTPISELDPRHWAWATAKHDSWYDYSTYWKFRSKSSVNWASNSLLEEFYKADQTDITKDQWDKIEKMAGSLENYVAMRQQYLEENKNAVKYDEEWNPESTQWVPEWYEQKIYGLAPTQLKNQVNEMERLIKKAKTYYDAWLTPREAILTYYWIKKWWDKTWLQDMLIDTLWNSNPKWDMAQFYWPFSMALEEGRWIAAINKIENVIFSDEDNRKMADYSALMKKLDTLDDIVNTNSGVLWPISSRVVSKLAKFVENDTTRKYAQAAAALGNAYADFRHELMWANMTEAEMKKYEWIFPDDKDTVQTIKEKIESSRAALLADINWLRIANTLKPYTEYNQIYDNSAKLDFYKGLAWSSSSSEWWTSTSWSWWLNLQGINWWNWASWWLTEDDDAFLDSL